MLFHYKKYSYNQKQNLKIKITLQTDGSNSTLKKKCEKQPYCENKLKNAIESSITSEFCHTLLLFEKSFFKEILQIKRHISHPARPKYFQII